MSPADKKARLAELQGALAAHPLAARVKWDSAYLLVTLPRGYSVGQVRTSHSCKGGKVGAVQRVLPVLERLWTIE